MKIIEVKNKIGILIYGQYVMKNLIFLLLFSVMIMLFIIGCGISGCRINFDNLKYPVSMSGSLYDPTGNLIGDGKGLKINQRFEYTTSLCSIFYSLIPLSRSDDMVEQMNKKIEVAGGDGMTNVSVKSDYSMLTAAFPLSLLPMWPGCSKVTINGTIVTFE